jgi:hypothetical protein
MCEGFISRDPSLEDYWRGIILFGRNVASYKFALAKALLTLTPASGQLVKLSDLAVPFARSIAEHLKIADKQGTARGSKFLDACRKYNAGDLSQDQLVDHAVRYGFNNVIDAFHVIGTAPIPTKFFIDERSGNNGIRITDEFSALVAGAQVANLPLEAEARWRLVETAWELAVPRSLVYVSVDPSTHELFAPDKLRRRAVTSCRSALSGYQKGKCFYCFRDIQLEGHPEVDHFFPHILKRAGFEAIIDGIWNLVLACRQCNSGIAGKSDRIPCEKLLYRLSRRNEFLIGSHHPLRETLMQQTGLSEQQRGKYLRDFHVKARSCLPSEMWTTTEVSAPAF